MSTPRNLTAAMVTALGFLAGSPALAIVAAPVGDEFQINTSTTFDQLRPAIATDGNGSFMVVWKSVHPGVPHIFGQRLDGAGDRLGTEFQVSTYITFGQYDLALAALPGGGFVVAWGGYGGQDHDGIFGRRIDAAGVPVGAEFLINTYTSGLQQGPAIAVDASGTFVVVWADGASSGIFGARFDASGARLGADFQVNTNTTGNGQPAVAAQSDGSFVVVWYALADGDSGGIFGQRFDGTGARVGAEFQANTYTTGFQAAPAVAADAAGNFVVLWSGGGSGDSYGVSGQRFAAAGTRIGDEFMVNTYSTGLQSAPRVDADGSGHFVVVWSSFFQNASWDVFGQQFAPDATRIGTEFQVNTYTPWYQRRPSIALDDTGRFVVVWSDYYAEDGSLAGIFGQAYGEPPIALQPSTLHFGVVRSGGALTYVTPPQAVALTLTFPGTWTAVSDQPFVSVTPSGSGTGTLTVQIASATGLPVTGAAPTATITVHAPGAVNSPQTITVTTQVYATGTTSGPFGSFDTPSNGAIGIAGAIPVTGWALDDIGVSSVKLYRDPVSADPPDAIAANGKVFIADAVFVAGQRPDVEAIYPTMPLNSRAASGYMLLTNFLPSGPDPVGGNGPFTLYAYMFDIEGQMTLLGSKMITVDNANATKPFGTIDTPAQGATVSGTLDNFGWALTPGTAMIPTDGSTVQVFVDGVFQGTAQYNLPRNDIQTLFPGYTNSGGPIGYFQIDTTQLSNGVHTIFWIVTDDQARADGIGSRYFTVLN